MDYEELLKIRRSVRAYDASRTVTKEQAETVIEAALEAPSWKNTETGRYYCVLGENEVKKFRETCLPEFNRQRTEGAAYIVTAFVSDLSGHNQDKTPTNECGNGWGFYDLGLQNENLLLKAKELGLDTLVMGIRDSEKIRQCLDIPEEETIVSVIAIGYGAEAPSRPKRKALDEVLKFI